MTFAFSVWSAILSWNSAPRFSGLQAYMSVTSKVPGSMILTFHCGYASLSVQFFSHSLAQPLGEM